MSGHGCGAEMMFTNKNRKPRFLQPAQLLRQRVFGADLSSFFVILGILLLSNHLRRGLRQLSQALRYRWSEFCVVGSVNQDRLVTAMVSSEGRAASIWRSQEGKLAQSPSFSFHMNLSINQYWTVLLCPHRVVHVSRSGVITCWKWTGICVHVLN